MASWPNFYSSLIGVLHSIVAPHLLDDSLMVLANNQGENYFASSNDETYASTELDFDFDYEEPHNED